MSQISLILSIYYKIYVLGCLPLGLATYHDYDFIAIKYIAVEKSLALLYVLLNCA